MSDDVLHYASQVSTKTRKGIFPGWRMVIAGGIMCMWGYGIYIYAFGSYVKVLIADFGWTRAQLSLAYSFGRLEGGIEGPFGGIATDRFGPRAVNLAGFLMAGLGLCLMYFVNSLWMFYLAWLAVSIGFNLGLAGPLDAALANWFVKRRGTTIALMRAGNAFAGPVIIPLMTLLLYAYGWRNAFLAAGVVTWGLGIPLTWFFIKPRRPEYYGWLPDGKRVGEEATADTDAVIQTGVEYAAQMEEVEFTLRQALKDRIWWICTIAMAFRNMIHPAIMVHTIPYLTDMGVSPMVAATAMGTLIFMTAPGRLLFGWLGDVLPKRRLRFVVMLAQLIEGLGLFILIWAPSMAWIWVFLVVYGFGSGASVMIWPPLRGRYWGRKAFATIQGLMLPITMVPGIIAPVYAGWAYDTTSSYTFAFSMMLVLLGVSTVMMYFATPPKAPEKVGKITEIL